jgi:CobQ-like glutamine amidotransferase family enzyme
MHGPFLPNNPRFCDELIKIAAGNKGHELPAARIDDSLTDVIRSAARRRKY